VRQSLCENAATVTAISNTRIRSLRLGRRQHHRHLPPHLWESRRRNQRAQLSPSCAWWDLTCEISYAVRVRWMGMSAAGNGATSDACASSLRRRAACRRVDEGVFRARTGKPVCRFDRARAAFDEERATREGGRPWRVGESACGADASAGRIPKPARGERRCYRWGRGGGVGGGGGERRDVRWLHGGQPRSTMDTRHSSIDPRSKPPLAAAVTQRPGCFFAAGFNSPAGLEEVRQELSTHIAKYANRRRRRHRPNPVRSSITSPSRSPGWT